MSDATVKDVERLDAGVIPVVIHDASPGPPEVFLPSWMLSARDNAWARLVKAACPPCDGMCCADEANAEYDGARQALCDLGVPVDELLGEP